eukprot:COSAG01_NODE_9394_length_2457_cov_1.412214_2_plen_163_part_00
MREVGVEGATTDASSSGGGSGQQQLMPTWARLDARVRLMALQSAERAQEEARLHASLSLTAPVADHRRSPPQAPQDWPSKGPLAASFQLLKPCLAQQQQQQQQQQQLMALTSAVPSRSGQGTLPAASQLDIDIDRAHAVVVSTPEPRPAVKPGVNWENVTWT